MRFSSLLVAAFLLVSAILLAQHSAGAGASEFSGFRQFRRVAQRARFHVIFVFIGEPQFQQFSVARRSRQRRGATPTLSTKSAPTSPASTAKHSEPEKRGFRLLSPPSFQEAVPVETAEFKRPCWKEPCPVWSAGRRPQRSMRCPDSRVVNPGQYWNGLACGVQYLPNEDCRALAAAWRSRSSGCVPWLVPSSKLVPVIPTARNAAICEPNPPAKACCMNNCEDNTSSVCWHARSYGVRSSFERGDPWTPFLFDF